MYIPSLIMARRRKSERTKICRLLQPLIEPPPCDPWLHEYRCAHPNFVNALRCIDPLSLSATASAAGAEDLKRKKIFLQVPKNGLTGINECLAAASDSNGQGSVERDYAMPLMRRERRESFRAAVLR